MAPSNSGPRLPPGRGAGRAASARSRRSDAAPTPSVASWNCAEALRRGRYTSGVTIKIASATERLRWPAISRRPRLSATSAVANDESSSKVNEESRATLSVPMLVRRRRSPAPSRTSTCASARLKDRSVRMPRSTSAKCPLSSAVVDQVARMRSAASLPSRTMNTGRTSTVAITITPLTGSETAIQQIVIAGATMLRTRAGT